MRLFDGGSDRDYLLRSETGNYLPSAVKSSRNQIFIMFITNSNGVGIGKGFTAKFTFGNLILYIISEIEYLLYISIFSSCLR